MPNGVLAERVDSLESYMKDLSYQALRTERELVQLSGEMRTFKDEMRTFKDEMRAFKGEMLMFKDEMREFKRQSEQDRREMNRKWGELANKMGTLVEDIVAPNLPRIAGELFGCKEPEYFVIRARRRRGPDTLELDALTICENVALINETKSTLNARDVDDIVDRLELFPRFFPEFGDRRAVGILACLYPNEGVVRYATGKGVLGMGMGMGMGDETMQVLNPEAVREAMK